MTYKELSKLVREWQKRLRVQDWAVYLRKAALNGCHAQISMNAQAKSAHLEIDIQSHFDQEGKAEEDIEATIVHELLHLQFELIPGLLPGQDSVEMNLFEAGLELTAQALVAAKRGELVFSGPR